MEYAVILMQPEYRSLIDPRYKRKIETLVRKSAGLTSNSTSISEEQQLTTSSPCPFCSSQLVQREMTCSSCKNQIPFCIASGFHITRNELTFCPRCDFPALLPYLKKILTSKSSQGTGTSADDYSGEIGDELKRQLNTFNCPMCCMSVSLSELVPASDEKIDTFLASTKSA